MVDSVRTIVTGAINDAIFSPDGSTFFVAQGGTITAYSVETGAQANSWAIGTLIGGMDVSADGQTLVAAERTPGPTVTTNGVSTHTIKVYSINLTTAAIATYSATANSYYSPYDVLALANGKALISLNDLGSNSTPLASLDLTSGVLDVPGFASLDSYSARSIFDPAADHTAALIDGYNYTKGELHAVDENGSIHHGPVGFGQKDFRYEAVSTAGNLIVGLGYGNIELYDLQFNAIATPAILNQQFDFGRSVAGIALNAAGTRLYILDYVRDLVLEFDTADWHIVRGFGVSNAELILDVVGQNSFAFGDRMSISADGHFLSIIGSDKVDLVDLTSIHSTVGTEGNDTLAGGSGDDALFGFGGNDSLDGGPGADKMDGGAGNDTYYFDNIGDTVVERDGGGTDTVITSVSTTIPFQVEILQAAAGAAVTLSGRLDQVDTLIGSELNDTLLAFGTGDRLIGGLGDDRLDGGPNGGTIAVINSTRAAATITLGSGATVIVTSADGTDTLHNIDTIQFNDVTFNVSDLYTKGTEGDDTLTGGPGIDAIFGYGGNDTLLGGDGNDWLAGGAGDNILDGGAGQDTAIIESSRFVDSLSVAPNGDIRLGDLGQTDTLRSIEFIQFTDQTVAVSDFVQSGTSGADDLTATADLQYVFGGDGNDVLRTGTFANTRLEGGGGDDLFIANTPGTRFVGGEGIDTVDYGGSAAPVVAYLLPGFGTVGDKTDGYSSIENLIGSAFADQLNGDANDNVFTGGGGNDIFVGNGGNDTVVINATRASSTITVRDNGAYGEIQVTSSDGVDRLIGITTIRFSDQDVATSSVASIGTDGNDSLTTTGASLYGLGGDDVLTVFRISALVDGGSGYDIANVSESGFAGSPTFTFAGNGDIVVHTADAATLHDIEEVRISTGTFNATPIYTKYMAAIYTQYTTYAGRTPDAGEYAVWSSAMKNAGATADQIGKAILSGAIGNVYIDQQIQSAYQTYAGRAATQIELTNWEGTIRNANYDYSVVQKGILSDPLGKTYIDAQIQAAYQTYAGRAAAPIELTNWEGTIRNAGYDIGVVKKGILSDPLGTPYVDAQINAAYLTYAGRAAQPIEISNWEGTVRNSGGDVSVIKTGILTDPLGRPYVDAQINAAYLTYAGRAAQPIEISNWEGTVQNAGGDVSILRTGILTDPLGKTYVDAQITAAYQAYSGRTPVQIELTNWEGTIRNANNDFSVVKAGILSDQLGIGYATAQIDALYQRYDGRVATLAERTDWLERIRGAADFDTIRDTVMSGSGSAGTTTQLAGTSGNDTFHFASNPYITITGFDPAHDVIDLQGLGFSSINPLDAAHGRDVHQLDGTNDVFISLDATHEILLHNVTVAQLSGSDFLL